MTITRQIKSVKSKSLNNQYHLTYFELAQLVSFDNTEDKIVVQTFVKLNSIISQHLICTDA